MKFFLAILSLTAMAVCNNKAYAQKKNNSPKIIVIARPQQQQRAILLRWAVSTPLAWKLSNQYGFIVERYVVTRNKKILQKPNRKLISLIPFTPAPLNNWETLAKKDNYAAVIAQAIYGKDFELEGGDAKGIAKIINKSNELEQRYAMSLYAADNSFEAAKLAGWGWEDKDVKPGEKYLYRIMSAVPNQKLKIDSGSVYVGLADYEPLPKPGDISSVFGDKSVMLSWDYNSLRSYYNSYFVEKSIDGGKNFTSLSDLPVTNLNEKENKPSNTVYFIDSLKDNNTNFQYRIKGISAFGEIGPPSDPIVGKGKKLLAFVPNIKPGSVNEKGALQLQWEFDEAGNDLITGFTLNQTQTENGIYKTVLENILPTQRTLSFDKLYTSNYFTITAIAKEGESRTSFPILIQPTDSMPPAAPIGLEGTIDTNGVVTLTWKKNTENDLFGYKIFRANNPQEEMSVLSDVSISSAAYKDTVSIKTLNNKLYYAIAAFDQRSNQSAASTIIEIKKPDRIPPSAPVFTDYTIQGDKANLTWANSSDEDIAAHYLYRKEKNGDWQLIQQFNNSTNNYVDDKVESGETYFYKIVAKDESGLESLPTPALTISIPVNPAKVDIKNISSYVDRDKRYIEISWKDNLKEVEEYQLYKAVKGQPVTLWKIIKPEEGKGAIDQSININTEYEYGIRALLKNGAVGKYKSLTVKY
jgi:fibronectin type 3 domain-containing protein